MTIRAIGLLSPGEMGHVVAQVIVNHGMTVWTCLEGRSERTKNLAKAAYLEAAATYAELVEETDLILSILVPAEALKVAHKVAETLHNTDRRIVYVDCNAVSPNTALAICRTIEQAGSRFVDAGIIGPPPRREGTTRFYASGPDAAQFEKLRDVGLDVRVIGRKIGQASGLKMCYAALTKGIAALSTELLVAAQHMGLCDDLVGEFQLSQSERYALMEREIPAMPSKARRWVGEMEEIATTFADVGLTPTIYEGAANMYRFVGQSPLAEETAETRDKNRTLARVVEILALQLEQSDPAK